MRKKSRFSLLLLTSLLFISIGINPSSIKNPNLNLDSPNMVNPFTQDYESNSSSTSETVQLKIHQAYKNESIVPLDELQSSVIAPAPNASNYQTTNVKIQVNDIQIANYSEIVEEDSSGGRNIDSYLHLNSFRVKTDCYIRNASFLVEKDIVLTDDGPLAVYLFNSTWTGGVSEPVISSSQTIASITVDQALETWYNITLDTDYYLDNSQTENNTWFLGLLKDGGGFNFLPIWRYELDATNGDNAYAYQYSGSLTALVIDLGMKVGFSLNKTNVTPSDINLKVNNTLVNNNINSPSHNSGFWNRTGDSSSSNYLNFTFSSDWYNFDLDLNLTQLNYTKEIQISTNYTVESGMDVFWTTNSTFSAFDHRLDNNTITYVIPLDWSISDLKNATSSVLYSSSTNSTSKFVTVFGSEAKDGDWTLYCLSTNLLNNINGLKIGINGVETNQGYSNETFEFNATFSKPISGNVNVSVYYTNASNNMVFSNVTTVSEQSFVDLSNWDISSNITDYGTYIVQVKWNNDSESALIDKSILIAGAASLNVLNSYGIEIIRADPADAPFNVSIQYYDVFKNENITNAEIGHNASGSWFSEFQNNPNGLYNVTIDPSTFSSPGQKYISITVNKTSFMNYTFDYYFTAVNNTNPVWSIYQNSTLSVIRGFNATFYLNFNQTWGENSIDGALIEEISVESNFSWSYMELPGGNYSLSFNTSQIDVGIYNCQFNITKYPYKTQFFNINVEVTQAQTNLNYIDSTQIIPRWTGENATINFVIEDTSNTLNLIGVPSSALTVYNGSNPTVMWDRGNWNWVMYEIANGEYSVNISLNGLDSGNYSVILNLSYNPNYNFSTLLVEFYVRGNYTTVTLNDIMDASYQSLTNISNQYHIYQHITDIRISFNINDTEFGYVRVDDDDDDSVYIVYLNLTSYGTFLNQLTSSFFYDENIDRNNGTFTIPNGLSSGIYNITIIIQRLNYENATFVFELIIDDLLTDAQFVDIKQPDHNSNSLINVSLAEGFTVFAPYNLEINLSYWDSVNSGFVPIQATTANLNFDGNNIPSNYYGSNIYGWSIDYNLLNTGTFNITVTFALDDYENAIFSFNITIYILPTSAVYTDIYQPDNTYSPGTLLNISEAAGFQTYQPFDLLLNITYNDTSMMGNTISGASWANLNYNEQNFLSNYEINGVYGWVIPSINLSLGVFVITIQFGLEDYENATISFNITIEEISTLAVFEDILQPDHSPGTLQNLSLNSDYIVYKPFDLIVNMTFYDGVNFLNLTDATTKILQYNGNNFTSNYHNPSTGIYGWIIPSENLTIGTLSVTVYFGLLPYKNATGFFDIIVQIVTTNAVFVDIKQPDHVTDTLLGGAENNYQSFLGYDLAVNMTYNDTTGHGNEILGATIAYISFNGYNYTSNSYSNGVYGWVIPYENLFEGIFELEVIFSLDGYQNASYLFNVTIISEYVITIILVEDLEQLTVGNLTGLTVRVTYLNDSSILPLAYAQIILQTNNTDITTLYGSTDANGFVTFNITAPIGDYSELNITIRYVENHEDAYGVDSGNWSFVVNVIPPPGGIPIWVLGLILGVIVTVVVGIGFQKGVLAPRKRKFRELLINTASQFEDAINLKLILIIYKNTGTCVYSKSFGIEQIDPDLISGFLTAAQSFVRESMSSDGLSEIKSGDNHLLISDGENVRVTLVLGQPASKFLRANASKFVMLFENQYREVLKGWKGQINACSDAGSLIDDILHTSIILPHEINPDKKAIRDLSSSLSKVLLKIARSILSDDRNFFFIAQLVAEAKSRLNKNPPEILLGLNELLEKKAIKPIDLSIFESTPISEPELRLIAQRVNSLPNLTSEDKQNLAQQLADMNMAEREAALVSLQQGQKITSDESKRIISAKAVINPKEANLEIKKLLIEAKTFIKAKNFSDAILCYDKAEVIATQWKTETEAKKYRDFALDAQIADFNYTIRVAKKETGKLIKTGKTDDALILIQRAFVASSSLFKLGFTEYEKDVKNFNRKIAEINKIEKPIAKKVEVEEESKEDLIKEQKILLKEASKLEKQKNYINAKEVYVKLEILAEKLFKYGVMSATSDIKKYKTKINELSSKKNVITPSKTINADQEQLIDQKNQLFNIALEAEQNQDYVKSLVAYQQVINIYNTIGDTESMDKLAVKKNYLISMIPNIEEIQNHLIESAETHISEGLVENAIAELQYVKGIAQAVSNVQSLQRIEKLLKKVM